MHKNLFIWEFTAALFVIVSSWGRLYRVHYDEAIKMVFSEIFNDSEKHSQNNTCEKVKYQIIYLIPVDYL